MTGKVLKGKRFFTKPQGKYISENSEYYLLLFFAFRLGCNEIVSFLLGMGHAVDPIDSSASKMTPLMEAIENNFLETAVLLVDSGASLASQDINNENAFHYAARNGSAKLIKLITRSADLSRDNLRALCCVVDIKLRFPEDLSSRSLAREVLVCFRELGYHPQKTKAVKTV